MKEDTKKSVNVAVDSLKKDGYAVIMVMLNQKSETNDRLEVLCSETNDPRILRAMLMNTLKILSQPEEVAHLN